ncbi:ABC transporter permease subunit [Corynebacterium felinum]|uniref:Peptide/nickel transport system permease protein n=1 Tax=Corynebacterium felinum TaxID=131318 RepID=A0ABU2BBK7_9CORY|nr:ABC transporter permease subunit [Corynebacterium felinum]MDF5819874.1 ABC transporter permease subunit [Corynebacterium felinum]MDR7355983.1 peptide/nickel transport system permease protein [Corynebacterium felinum]WJY95319.1 Peptide transport system permease protein SapC [Corynebacterium felinum]
MIATAPSTHAPQLLPQQGRRPGILLRRFLRGLVFPCTLVAAGVLITAALPFITGRDLALSVFRAREAEREPDPVVLEAIRNELDLPDSAWSGLIQWLARASQGDFGVSWVDPSTSAAHAALRGLNVSASIAGLSTAVAVVLAIILVLPRITAVMRGKPSKASHIMGMAIMGSIPEFVLAVVLLVIFGLRLGLLPVSGYSSPAHLVMPVLSLAIPSAGLLGRILLITIDGLAHEEWVRMWRLNRVRDRAFFLALMHRSLAVLLPQIVLFFAGTLAATVLVETAFNVPGIGRTAVVAATNRDIPVLQVLVLTTIVVGLVTGTLSQLLRHVLLHPLISADSASSTAQRTSHRPTARVLFLATISPFVALILLALVTNAPVLDVNNRLLAPSSAHIVGTDQLGRDLLVRLAHGAVFSLGAAFLVTCACAVVGLFLGLAGVWVSKLGDALNALPAVLIGVILAGVFGPSQTTAAIAVLLVGWIPLAAHASSVAAEVRTTGFYRWAALQGASRMRLVWVHTMPTLVPAVARHAASRIAHNALALVSLGFLGLGAAHDSPNWGMILNESIRYAERAPWMMLAPTVLLILLGIASALATDADISWKKPTK